MSPSLRSYTGVTLVAPDPPPGGSGPSDVAYAGVTLVEPPPEGGFGPSARAYAQVTLVAPAQVLSPIRVSLAGEPWRVGREVHWNGTQWV